jgi:hypothetical protein
MALLVLPIRAALSSVSFSKIVVRVVLYMALWPPVWLPRLLTTGVATRHVPDPGVPSISGPIGSIKKYSCIQICYVKGISVV